MKRICVIIFLFANTVTFGQAPNWLWAKSDVGSGSDGSLSIATDADGNAYVTGIFYSTTISFGNNTLSNVDSTGSTCDIFIVKYDALGNVLWASSAGGTDNELGYSITSESSGNLYITGYFQSPTLTFGNSTLTNIGGGMPTFFMAKYDSSGIALWARSTTGISYSEGTSITTDVNGNSYMTGWFDLATITFGSITLTNTGTSADVFIVKYDSSGNVVWAKSAGGNNYYDSGSGITADVNGNLYVTGWFGGSNITFGGIVLTNASVATPHADIFVVKYDISGNVLWAKSAGGSGYDYSSSITADANGNSLITGSFDSPTVTFGSIILTSTGSDDFFVAKYDSVGNIVWANCAGGISSDYGNSVAVDPSGNSYVTGNFLSHYITFGSTTLTNAFIGVSVYTADIFITKYDIAGNVLWAERVGEIDADGANCIAVDLNGNSYITGVFIGNTITFGTTVLSNSGAGDAFIAKLDNTTGIGEEMNSSMNAININPNPASNIITITFPDVINKSNIEIYNVLGEKVFSQQPAARGQKQVSIDVSKWNKGIYFVKVSDACLPDRQGEKQYAQKVVIQ